MQTFYILLVYIQVVVMVQIENFKVWKRCEITIKQYKIVCIELAGCMSYGSSPYENTRDQINKYISIWVNRPTNIFSTQMNGLPYTISRKLFPRGALIFFILVIINIKNLSIPIALDCSTDSFLILIHILYNQWPANW